ncbi:MAG: hypothetical protein ACPGJI_08135 [Kangiellaceae bacterium]
MTKLYNFIENKKVNNSITNSIRKLFVIMERQTGDSLLTSAQIKNGLLEVFDIEKRQPEISPLISQLTKSKEIYRVARGQYRISENFKEPVMDGDNK